LIETTVITVVQDDTVNSIDKESDNYDKSSSDEETESDKRHYDNYYNNELEVSDTESEDLYLFQPSVDAYLILYYLSLFVE